MTFIVLFSVFSQNGKLSTQNIQASFPVMLMGRSKRKPMDLQVCHINLFPRHFTELSTEDGEAEDDVTGDEPAQSTSLRNNLGVVTNEEEKGAASHEDTDEYIAQEVELATPAISSGVEILEPVNP